MIGDAENLAHADRRLLRPALQSVVEGQPAGHHLGHAAAAGLPQTEPALESLHFQTALALAVFQVAGTQAAVPARSRGVHIQRWIPAEQSVVQLRNVGGLGEQGYASTEVAGAAFAQVLLPDSADLR